MSNATPGSSEPISPAIALQVISTDDQLKLVLVDHDEFTIGAGEQCDLSLPTTELPRLHSMLHVQGHAIWIEAVHPDAMVIVNGEIFRWRALRDGDQLTFHSVEALVHIGEESIQAAQHQLQSQRQAEDLTLLTAEELCDRIEREEARVREFGRRRRLGWQALLSAIQDAQDAEDGVSQDGDAAVPIAAGEEKLNELVAQVRDLSETLDERTKNLAAQEALLVESSSQLCEAQRRVSRQLDQLMERLLPDDNRPSELRVSA